MSIVTKTGDRGTTGLFGGGRVSKSSTRIHAYGTVDELNAVLGVVLAEADLSPQIRSQLLHIQRLLFMVGADLASPLDNRVHIARMRREDVQEIEQWVYSLEDELLPLRRFILPSGSRLGSLLHLARTVCRRAERWVVALEEHESVNGEVRICLNRLSDYLFMAARKVNVDKGVSEVEVVQ